jgi:hypothetical protein
VARLDRSLQGRREWRGGARGATGRQRGGVGPGRAWHGMWHGGGRALNSVTPRGGGRRADGRRQPGNDDAGSRTGEAGEERRERARAPMSGLTRRVGPSCREREKKGERVTGGAWDGKWV